MNLINPYRFGSSSVEVNTFIGGIGATTTTASALETLLGLTSGDVVAFSIDASDNISCNISVDYYLTASFYSNTEITWFIDLDGHVDEVNNHAFRNTTNMKAIVLPGLEKSRQTFMRDNTLLTVGCFPLRHNITNSTNQFYQCKLKRLYLPLVTYFTHLGNNNNSFYGTLSTMVLYLHEDAETIDSGNPDGDVEYFRDTVGGTIRYITDTTPPADITNLSAGTITSTTVVLNFTAPSSTNTLDFYEVWIDDGSGNPSQLYYPFAEIIATGATLTGLVSGTTYKIKLAACDEFMNGSGLLSSAAWSNEIEITTL